MLTIADLVIEYPDFHACYRLTAAAGELCAIVGPSGGGKTTLLNAIAGFETPQSGVLAFDGVDLSSLPPGKRPAAMVFQDHNLFPHLTAGDNVALGLRPSLDLSRTDAAEVEAALGQVGLAGLGRRLPSELSGGQRQRVALARALVSRRRLLLLDEPFGALDPGLRREMIGLVDRLRRDKALTTLMTIHTPEDVMDVADRMVFIADGMAIAEGAPHDVLRRGRDPRIDAYVGCGRARG